MDKLTYNGMPMEIDNPIGWYGEKLPLWDWEVILNSEPGYATKAGAHPYSLIREWDRMQVWYMQNKIYRPNLTSVHIVPVRAVQW